MSPRRAPHRPLPAQGTPSHDPAQRARDIIARCHALGFALAGVATLADILGPDGRARHADTMQRWIDDGAHGSMAYMAEQLSERLQPDRILTGCRAFVMVADQYAPRGDVDPPPASDNPPSGHPVSGQPGSGRAAVGKIARYARGRDYHRTIKRRLHALADQLRIDYPGSEYRSFCDTAPMPERELALAAGLGWIGRNTMLIHPTRGSWLLLGGMATTLELAAPPERRPIADHCGTCTRCIDACPTRAITLRDGVGRVDARRCVSALTIEHEGPIDPTLHAGIGSWIYGCDICQEVCPHNSARDGRPLPILPDYTPTRRDLDPAEVARWTPEDRERALINSAMKRATLAMFHRNAAICLENAGQSPISQPPSSQPPISPPEPGR